MKIGKLEIQFISDGVIKMDGGAMFGQLPKVVWEQAVKPDRRNRIKLGMNCLVIRSSEGNVLVDTGAGSKSDENTRETYGLGTSKLIKNLREIGLAAKDINYVVLTHLHFEHAGGSTKLNRRGSPVATFPNARYLIQRDAWEEANNPNERGKGLFCPDDFLPLMQREQIQFLDGDFELAPGVVLKVTRGHCPGHQIVVINHVGSRVAFLGDLIPTPYHLTPPSISAVDQFPEETLEKKRELLKVMERDGWLILFAHGYETRAGYLERREGRLILKPAEV
jgi:glyoxylase-like metal-dependent hydrolase (beta-lactamase superfamily II)